MSKKNNDFKMKDIGLFFKKKNIIYLLGLVLLPLILLGLFLVASDWVDVGRLTSKKFINRIEAGVNPFPAGYRRAHGKGICFVGEFYPSSESKYYSKAILFEQKSISVNGRFSIGGGNPHAQDNTSKTVSMALLMETADGQQWRMAMNNSPFFETSVPEGFYDKIRAFAPDAKTGKPDSLKISEFYKKYPEAKSLIALKEKSPWPDSFASSSYYSVNSFRFIAKDGTVRHVRWEMKPHILPHEQSESERKNSAKDFLKQDITKRLRVGPVYWDMVVTIADEGDPVNDPSKMWPANRKKIILGTLKVISIADQENSPCRDINYDPTILPYGIAISDDPVLKARSGAYSQSYNKRLYEIGAGKVNSNIKK